MTEASARTWIVATLTLHIDNDWALYQMVTGSAVEAVRDYAPGESDGGRSAFQMALADRGAPGYTREDYANAVGEAVADAIGEWLDSMVTASSATALLTDVLDLNDSTQAAMLGDYYLPESVEDAFGDDDE